VIADERDNKGRPRQIVTTERASGSRLRQGERRRDSPEGEHARLDGHAARVSAHCAFADYTARECEICSSASTFGAGTESLTSGD
jgi:hypothetical protein